MLKVSGPQQDHLPKPIEYLVILMIILVIIYTVIEELALIGHWSHDHIVRLIWVGFAFDLFFTFEFMLRSLITARHGHFMYYVRAQRGWIDFLTSVPLLLLVSGPAVIMLLLADDGGYAFMGFLSVLKTAKAIRVTRILRLIRIIKLFGKIQNTESAMTNRHVGTISTMMVVTLIVVLMFSQFIPQLHIGNRDDHFVVREKALTELFQDFARGGPGAPSQQWIVDYIRHNPDYNDVIRIRNPEGKEIYESEDVAELSYTAYRAKSMPEHEHFPLGDTGYEFQLSYHSADAEHSKLNLFILLTIVAIILTMMFLYTRIFAQQVADPIYIMDKGLRQWDYNLEVKISKDFPNDEVMHLAKAYNSRWLTVKNQIRAFRRTKEGDQEKSALSIDDIL